MTPLRMFGTTLVLLAMLISPSLCARIPPFQGRSLAEDTTSKATPTTPKLVMPPMSFPTLPKSPMPSIPKLSVPPFPQPKPIIPQQLPMPNGGIPFPPLPPLPKPPANIPTIPSNTLPKFTFPPLPSLPQIPGFQIPSIPFFTPPPPSSP